jgi:hypothetical protein
MYFVSDLLSEENNAIKQFLEASRDKNYCLLPCNDKQEILKIRHRIYKGQRD